MTKGYRVPSALKRSDVLEANRNRKMASSAHAYVRANTIKFYKWLESQLKIVCKLSIIDLLLFCSLQQGRANS